MKAHLLLHFRLNLVKQLQKVERIRNEDVQNVDEDNEIERRRR
jgi:hypothetical protein